MTHDEAFKAFVEEFAKKGKAGVFGAGMTDDGIMAYIADGTAPEVSAELPKSYEGFPVIVFAPGPSTRSCGCLDYE